ncbi:hypothetical protein [Lactobacillus iners]|nr:hypothetical protein [Lactobacillus iners]EFO68526.1 hypothetical protein HMPREF9212_0171 [Lactobacillus iners LactinV 03V1-b]CQB89122.1 Uncharacterised protein [Chlamydia trachomatis]EGY58754.1 hypothetical protein HMPREF1027_01107 [Lactobacillus iners]MCT7671436.1 hypothetical protein [Lactobacillus iners]MCT7682627.1 hypothetical protein [Lactobacillus iners]
MEKANEKKQYLLANHSDDPFARQIEMLDSFNGSGISTSKLQADLSQKTDMYIYPFP